MKVTWGTPHAFTGYFFNELHTLKNMINAYIDI
jgi:hypothetical protein